MSNFIKLVFVTAIAVLLLLQIINMAVMFNISFEVSKLESIISLNRNTIGSINAVVNGLRNQVNSLTDLLNEQSWLLDWEFTLVEFSENDVTLRGRWTFSEVSKDQNLYILLHPVNSGIEEKIKLKKLTDVTFTANLVLDMGTDYVYQIIAEDDNGFVSSEEYSIPLHYYKAQTFSTDVDFFVNTKNEIEYPELRFRFEVTSKPYFEELRINKAELVIKKNYKIVDTKIFTEERTDESNKITFPSISGEAFYVYYPLTGQENLKSLDFFCEVTYRNGLEKTVKMNTNNEKWKSIITYYETYIANQN
ncbi:MAG: hypothetical protein ACP5D6_03825 [Kosmotogaceae bacterium]